MRAPIRAPRSEINPANSQTVRCDDREVSAMRKRPKLAPTARIREKVLRVNIMMFSDFILPHP
jgi:hypothetical protein